MKWISWKNIFKNIFKWKPKEQTGFKCNDCNRIMGKTKEDSAKNYFVSDYSSRRPAEENPFSGKSILICKECCELRLKLRAEILDGAKEK